MPYKLFRAGLFIKYLNIYSTNKSFDLVDFFFKDLGYRFSTSDLILWVLVALVHSRQL